MKIIRFLSSRQFLINLSIILVLMVALYFILIYSLNSYTHHGEKMTVPELVGLTYKDALELAQQSNLKVIVTDTTYGDDSHRGLIAAQIPVQNAEVKSDRTIYLTINAMTSEMVKVPNFVGTSLRQAMADADIVGLKIGNLNYVPDIAKNNVLEQSYNNKPIPAGTYVEKGTFIDLTLGMGLSNEKVFIPLLVNKTFVEADSLLRSKYLNTGATFYDVNIKTKADSMMAKIYKQQPEPFNKNFKPGDFVDIWLTIDTSKIFIKQAWKDSLRVKSDTILTVQ
ncbi:MAG: PASTA domain-containing protein [Bacteroidales bacterium]|nr:PASTA domain-containing protein [Bacteroidales bacterium]